MSCAVGAHAPATRWATPLPRPVPREQNQTNHNGGGEFGPNKYLHLSSETAAAEMISAAGQPTDGHANVTGVPGHQQHLRQDHPQPDPLAPALTLQL